MVTKQIETAIIYRFGFTKKQASEVVKLMLLTIQAGVLNDGTVRLDGIGTFKVVQKPARIGRNPRTGEAVEVPAKAVVKFKPSSRILS